METIKLLFFLQGTKKILKTNYLRLANNLKL